MHIEIEKEGGVGRGERKKNDNNAAHTYPLTNPAKKTIKNDDMEKRESGKENKEICFLFFILVCLRAWWFRSLPFLCLNKMKLKVQRKLEYTRKKDGCKEFLNCLPF